MKVNKTTALLAFALLGIWGGIGYVVYAAVKDPESISKTAPRKNNSVQIKESPFTLFLNYDDPFLTSKNTPSGQSKNTEKVVTAKTKPESKKRPEIKPAENDVRYVGLIEGNKKLKSIVMRINGEEVIYDVSDKIEGYDIKKATTDSLVLKKGKQMRIILRD